jgi:protein O-GlcNAc transferase
MSVPFDQGRSLDINSVLRNAVTLHQQGHLADAERLYRQILAIAPQHFDALQLLGAIKIQQGHDAEGADLIAQALRINPNSARALLNLGFALLHLNRDDEAAASFGNALALNPVYVQAFYGRGAALAKLQRPQDALADFDRALGLRPDYADALIQRGHVLFDLNNYEQALTSYDRAVAVAPGNAEALNGRGAALHQLKRSEEALASFERVLAIEPDHPHAFGGALGSAMTSCDWPKRAKLEGELEARITRGKSMVHPFLLLSCSDDPSLALQCAKKFVHDRIPARPQPLWNGTVRPRDHIRIAYLSADFHEHPTAYLISELLERHDRAHFEVIGISFGPDDGSATRARIAAALDRFYDVRSKSDREIAVLLDELTVDIAIDLKGLTADCRPGILAHRPAPIAVSYLGFPGTMGADFIDYVIADETVLPFHQQPFFSEKIVHLPDCYQINDSLRSIAKSAPVRREAGLPEHAFVFCCFNNNHKIAAPVFDIWMRILRKIEGGVLWLLRADAVAERNLRREAAARGIDPARLVFADRVDLPEHLARHRLADLFLDTLPFNAHTTASDALWAGLPLLTCRGKSFQGRVAASLLQAIGLPELATDRLEDYEAMAVKLASEPPLLASLREKLGEHRRTHPLFDTDRFRRHIEAAYVTMWESSQRGENPRGFTVPAIPE